MDENKVFDVAVIGGGIVGTGITYELSKYKLSVALIEKSVQVTQGSSKGNSGIIHAGYDDPENSLRGKLVTKGNKRYDDWASELGVGLKRPGSMVVAFDESDLDYLKELKQKGDIRKVPVELLDKQAVLKAEPNINPDVIGALRAPTAGIICPMRFVNFLFKNSVKNGVTPFMDHEVTGFELSENNIKQINTSKGKVFAKIVINAAGLFGDSVSSMAGIDKYEIHPRKGEYILLEPHSDYNVNHIIFPTPTKESKGALVVPTETGDILIGPTSVNLHKNSSDDLTTSILGLKEVFDKTKHLVPGLHTGLTVKTYAGNRAQPNTNDFIIERYNQPENFINVIGIRSPGLTAAPAIADMVISLVQEISGSLEPKENFTTIKFEAIDQPERALTDIAWADSLTPNLDSPSMPLMERAWKFGVKKELYNYFCFSDRGLGVDLGATFQNEMIKVLLDRGQDYNEILFRLKDSQQVVPSVPSSPL
ncbi:MAG: FAD-dependent oxidoreductase [Spirochaetales bacterium]|nr:FAD-dependent oxidoreductase [Spirochaetales bacterium]